MITTYFKTIQDTKLKVIDKVRVGSWINITNATRDDLEEVVKLTGLEYIDIDDSLDRFEIPRFERQNGNTIVFVRNPSVNSDSYHTEILTIVFSDKYLITISPEKNSTIEYLLNSNKKLVTTQQTKLLISILLNVAQQFTYEIKEVRNRVLMRKNNIEEVDTPDFIALAESEEILNQYLSALIPNNNVLEGVISSKAIKFHEEDTDLLDDLLITLRQSADICNVSISSIRSTRDSYQVIFTNNLNKTIKLLTSLTIILTIPTILASIFGMNVRLPLDADNPFSFGIILLIISVCFALALLIFNLKRWL